MVLIIIKIGAPEEIRTPDLRFRRPLLYPTELLEHWSERWESNPLRPGPQPGVHPEHLEHYIGSAYWTRTSNQRINNPLLYLLS